MGRTSFVAWLFIMALACVVIAATSRSWGWFLGGIVLGAVAMFALRQFKKEQETEPEEASGSFVVKAILAMLVVMGLLFWLQFKA